MRFTPPHSETTEVTKPGRFSGIGILLSNLVAIVIALVQNWDLGPMLVIYWSQSVIIGIFHFFRMLLLRNFCTDGFTSNGRPVPETRKGKISTAIFFAFHYGFFHLGYLVFLVVRVAGGEGDAPAPESELPSGGNPLWIAAAVGAFLIGHAFSFRQNVAADLRGRPNLGTMMFLPYARIIPMHLTIILGASFASNRLAVLLFSLLKTGADLLMHVVEHRVLQKHLRSAAKEAK